MKLVDVHCHLDLRQFEKDLKEAIERAGKAGLSAVLQNSLNPASIRKSLQIAERFDIVRLALGLYPVDALKLSDEEIDSEIDFIKKQINTGTKVLAVGEVGLDYHWVRGREEQARQRKIFEKFIALAEETKKPLIIHSRESEKDAFELLQSSNAKAVFHCFNGSIALAKKVEDSGYYFSIPASVVFINHFRDLVKQVGIKQLFAETDAPYMNPFRGKRNEPAFVLEAYKMIAELKKKSVEEISEIIMKNYKLIFL